MNGMFCYGKVKKVTSESLTVVGLLAGVLLHFPDLQVSKNGKNAIIHKAKWSNSYFMSISFITQETIDGTLDSSNFDATNEIEDTLNSIINSIEESWDSNSDKFDNSDKVNDSITTSDFISQTRIFFF